MARVPLVLLLGLVVPCGIFSEGAQSKILQERGLEQRPSPQAETKQRPSLQSGLEQWPSSQGSASEQRAQAETNTNTLGALAVVSSERSSEWEGLDREQASVRGLEQRPSPPLSALAKSPSPVGLAKLNAVRSGLAKFGATLFFTLMDQSGFTPAIADALAKYKVTFLVPPNNFLQKYVAGFRKLTKSQQQQVIGYHVLTGVLTLRFLVSVKKGTEFKTADYDYTVAKFSNVGQPSVLLSQPKAKAATARIITGGVFLNPSATVTVHLINGLMTPPKYN